VADAVGGIFAVPEKKAVTILPMALWPTRESVSWVRMAADDTEELVPIPLDEATRARLVHFARAIGEHPTRAASTLLRELLRDDEFWNAAATEQPNIIN
jgi:hypothetical protein